MLENHAFSSLDNQIVYVMTQTSFNVVNVILLF